ncbi:non-homologous end-joining factor 1-like isoform X2 [Anneissia japonica]|uniref:non-homologous end-joining factor 1-like isoform X2 n=1 Tax=Anneissia japonica TaxID=1529436 RepID=UPI001425549E|nr:non-homologous end-joining factor 1-like isoform X2 [Anneissia japonica]
MTDIEVEAEWQENLELSMKYQVWSSCKIDETPVLLKTFFTSTAYEIAIYDFKQLWFECCDEATFSKRVKELNPNIEAPSTTLLQHIQDNLTKESVTLKIVYSKNDEEKNSIKEQPKMTINWSSQLIGGVPFTWQYYLVPADNQQVCSHLITPLMTMVGEMSRRESDLMKLLSKKDAEIEDYKAAGGKVSRKYLRTVPFDEKAFRKEMITSKGFEQQVLTGGLSAFAGSAGDLYKEVQIKHSWLSRSQGGAGVGPMDEFMLDGRLLQSDFTTGSPMGSPTKSITPHQSPVKIASAEGSPTKDTELLRRQALERKLNEERTRQESKRKKKKIF